MPSKYPMIDFFSKSIVRFALLIGLYYTVLEIINQSGGARIGYIVLALLILVSISELPNV